VADWARSTGIKQISLSVERKNYAQKLPKDARFVISAVPSDRSPPHHIEAAWEFVPTSAPVTCATAVKS
jgi:hypothetical protein